MSMGPVGGVVGSAAGAPLAQTKGAESERSQRDASARATARDADRKAEQSSGVGQTQEDQGAGDRDADGRRIWEAPPEDTAEPGDGDGGAPAAAPRPRDASGESGGKLDLLG
ncbi:MAG: hypothetical protein AAF790_11175 [Planctomycetota bacterium]